MCNIELSAVSSAFCFFCARTCLVTYFQPSSSKKIFNARPSAIVSMQGRHLDARPSSRRNAVNATQNRHAGPSAQIKAVVSTEGRNLDTRPVNSTQWPSTQCKGRLFQMQGSLSAQKKRKRHLNTNNVPSAPCRARLLNAGPVCSTQRLSAQRKTVSQLDAKRSRGRQLNATPYVSMQAHSTMQTHHFNARPSSQRRADTSMQGRLVNLTMIF